MMKENLKLLRYIKKIKNNKFIFIPIYLFKGNIDIYYFNIFN